MQVKEGSQVDVGQLIAVTVEKGMDWKSAVIPTSTKPVAKQSSTAAPPKATPTQSGQPAPSDQYVFLKINTF